MISHLNTFGGGAGIEPGAVGDYHWPLNEAPEPLRYDPNFNNAYMSLTTAQAVAIGETVTFNFHATGTVGEIDDVVLVTSDDGLSWFGWEGSSDSPRVAKMLGFTAKLNGVAIVDGDILPDISTNPAPPFPSYDAEGRYQFHEVELTATITTNVKYLLRDSSLSSGSQSRAPVYNLRINTGMQDYQWLLNDNSSSSQPEQNVGGNNISIVGYDANNWKNWPIHKRANTSRGISDLKVSNDTFVDFSEGVLGFKQPSMRSDGQGFSVNLKNLGLTSRIELASDQRALHILYNNGLTLEILSSMEEEPFVSSVGGHVGIVGTASNLNTPIFELGWNNYSEATATTEIYTPFFALIKRSALYDGYSRYSNTETEVRGSSSAVVGEIHHFIATIKPSNNSIGLWMDGVSIGVSTFPVAWWDKNGQSIFDLLTGDGTNTNQMTKIILGRGQSISKSQDFHIHLLEADQAFVDKQYNDARGRRSKAWNSTFESKMSIEGSFAGDSPEVDVNGSFSSIIAYPGSTVAMGANFSANSTNSIINWNGRLFIAFDITSTLAEAGFRLSTNGELRRKLGSGSGYGPYNNWLFGTGHLSTIGNGYEVKFSLNSGTLPTTGAALIDGATWHNLGTERDISIESTFNRFSEISATIRVVGDATTEKTSTLFIETANYL